MPTLERPNYSSIGRETAIERIIQLEESYGARFETHPRYGLTQAEQMLLGLVAYSTGICTKEHAYTVMYGMHDDPPLQKILDVYISKIRRKLNPLDIHIETAWGRGWYMEADQREKALALAMQREVA
jgi:two-component system cell cycle response regulator CtrA